MTHPTQTSFLECLTIYVNKPYKHTMRCLVGMVYAGATTFSINVIQHNDTHIAHTKGLFAKLSINNLQLNNSTLYRVPLY
jgi:hypothetical protein